MTKHDHECQYALTSYRFYRSRWNYVRGTQYAAGFREQALQARRQYSLILKRR